MNKQNRKETRDAMTPAEQQADELFWKTFDEFKTFVNDTTNLSWGAYYQRGTSGHAYKADQAIDGITFFASADNLKTGYFRVYGIADS